MVTACKVDCAPVVSWLRAASRLLGGLPFAPSPCPSLVIQEMGNNAVPSGVSTGCLTVRRVKWVQPFLPAHNLIRPQPRSSLPYRRRIHNLVVHQRRSPLPCRRSILLRRSASLHRSRTAAPGRARGLALLRNSGMPEGPLFYFLLLFSFWVFFSSVFFFVFFETPRLHSQKHWLRYSRERALTCKDKFPTCITCTFTCNTCTKSCI